MNDPELERKIDKIKQELSEIKNDLRWIIHWAPFCVVCGIGIWLLFHWFLDWLAELF